MNNDLYQTIEDIKTTLENIDSARKQVSDTVAAYSATQSGIQNYVDKLCDIENALKHLVALLQNNKVIIEQQASSAIANLQTTCTEITTRIQKGQEAMSLSFSEKLNSRIQEIDRQVSAFENSVKRAESLLQNGIGQLKDSNENIIQKLANNQHTIMESLNNLKNEISESKAEIEKQAKTNRNIGFATLALLLLLVILHFIA